MKRTILLLLLSLSLSPALWAERKSERIAASVVSPDKKTEIEANLRQAKHYMEKGDYVAAKQKLERVLELDKDHAEAKRLLAECDQKIEAQKKREYDELDKAVKAGTELALRNYIDRYPNGTYVEQAQKYLTDFQLWSSAHTRNTKESYQEYLSTSNVKGYKDEAELAIKTIDAARDWELCKKDKSIKRLESFISQYSGTSYEKEAQYELNLLRAEDAYVRGSHSVALSFYNEARKTHSLTGDCLKHFRELETEAQYDKIKSSRDVSALKDFLSRTSSTSPYYDLISNRLALILADRFSYSSSESDFNEALSYARNQSTRDSVTQSINTTKREQRSFRREMRRDARREARRRRWDGAVHFGWNIFDLYANSKTVEAETGLRLKFGRDDHLLNFLVGADLQLFYGSSGLETTMAVPASLRFNFGEGDFFYYMGLGALVYPGVGSNFGVGIEPQMGFTLWSCDMALHLRYIPNNILDNNVGVMLGYHIAIYF